MNLKFFTKVSFVLLLLITHVMYGFAQDKDISGQISDQSTGVPLAGVSVRLKGGSKVVVTDEKGHFSLRAVPRDATLILSHVGFEQREVKVGAGTSLNFTLLSSEKKLEDFVVVGYGSQRKPTLTGAIVSIGGKELEDIPTGNLATTLQGRFAGISVNGGTSRPGGNATIIIRNPQLLSKDGGTLSPLYVIDDVIRTEADFNLLDPTEVEDISILKDAAAAIYGVRSSQGVVVVRTRRGKAGKARISFNSSVASTGATMLPKMMDGYQLATYLNDMNFAGGKQPEDNVIYTPDELEHFKNNNFNWLDNAWKSSMQARQTINVSGGTDKATFFAGASYFYQNGNLDNINNSKWTFRASADVKLATGLKTSLSVSGDLANDDMYLLKQGGENAENDVKGLLYTPGYTPPYVNGLPVKMSNAGNQNTIDAFHFFEVQRLGNYSKSRNTGLNIIANMEYQLPFLKGLTAKVQYAKNLDNTFPKQFGTRYKVYAFTMLGEHKHIYGGEPILPAVSLTNGNRVYLKPSYSDSYQLNAYLSFNRQFGKHEVSALAVVEQTESVYDDVQAYTDGPTDGAPDNTRFAFGEMNVWETEREAGTLGYIGRVNYNYSNKYLLELAFRYDASTRFAEEYRWGFFPSAALGWVVSEENFFKSGVRFMDYLKLRMSAGHLGSDATKDWSYIQRYTPLSNGGPVFGGDNNRGVGTKPEQMPNPKARWDDNLKFNIGLETRFLRDRLSATVETFYDHRYNMLTSLTASVPWLIGSAIASENYSTVNGYGYELSIGWKDRINKDFDYSINGFLSFNEAKAIKVDIDKGKISTYEDPTGLSTDMGVQGYHYEGMFRTQAEVDAYLSKNPDYTVFGQKPMPGMLYYRDIRGTKDPLTNKYDGPDGKIDENDQDWIAPKASNHYGFGFSIGVGYKGIRLDMIISGAFGGQSSIEGAARKQATPTSSRPEFWSDHWTPENPDATYPSPYYKDSYDVMSSFWFKSSFSLRMRMLNLSYALPSGLTSRMGFNGFKIYMNAMNPFNFYNPYSYKDNAMGSFDVYPNLRTIAIGLNVSL